MQIPKNIKITDTNGKTVAFLSPKADGLKDCYRDTRLNGESTLEFMLPTTSEKIKELTPECEIWAGGRVYIIRKDDAIDTVRDNGNRLWTKVMAHERWYELDSSYIEPYLSNDPTIPHPADLSVIIVGGGSDLSGGQYQVGTAAHALYAILKGSGWSLGTVDVEGIRDLEAEKTSRLGLVKMVQEIWGGYLLFDSVNKVIYLRDANKWQPYNGFQIRYKKNLKHITRTQSNRIVTKLYPFGHDDLDIAAVNNGKKYITNHSYTSREYVGIYKNQDIYDQEELLEKATAELELMCRPRYLYKVKLVDVRVLPEYSHEDFTLGDMVDIVDPDITPDSPRPRIIRHRYNIFQPWNCELDIGDPEERLIEQLKASFNTTGFIDGKFNGGGKFSGYSIEHDTITARHIKAGSIEIGHLDEGVVPGLDLLQNPVFASYAEQVSVIDGIVGQHATLIQQNAEQISLQAIAIDGLGTDISSLSIRADGIESTVSRISHSVDGLEDDIDWAYSQITQLADEITAKVTIGDVVNYLSINRSGVQIHAANIDLTGITRIYDPNSTRNYAEIYAGTLDLVYNNNAYLSIQPDAIVGAYISTYGNRPIEIEAPISLSEDVSHYSNNVLYSRSYVVFANATVDFSNADVVGLDTDIDTRYLIECYYASNKCYLDLSSAGTHIIVRDRYGDTVGLINIE